MVIHATNGLKSSEDTAAREHRTSSRDRIFPQCSDRCVVAAAASSGQFSIAAGEAGNKMVSVPTVAILSRSRRSNSGLIAYHLFLPAQIVGWLRSAERRSVTSFGSSSATALRLSLRRSPREPAQASPTRQHSPGRPTGREPSESWRQTAQLRRHEICYVVGIALGANAIQVPGLRRDQQFALLIAENSSVSCPPAARNDGGD